MLLSERCIQNVADQKIYTGHKPLLGLLHPDKATPLITSSRMQRWALTLLAYEYELLYRPGNENGNADGLSCLPVLNVPGSTPVPGDIVHLLETINTSPVDATKIKLWKPAMQCFSKFYSLFFKDGLQR